MPNQTRLYTLPKKIVQQKRSKSKGLGVSCNASGNDLETVEGYTVSKDAKNKLHTQPGH